jgi:hypothetical protein
MVKSPPALPKTLAPLAMHILLAFHRLWPKVIYDVSSVRILASVQLVTTRLVAARHGSLRLSPQSTLMLGRYDEAVHARPEPAVRACCTTSRQYIPLQLS